MDSGFHRNDGYELTLALSFVKRGYRKGRKVEMILAPTRFSQYIRAYAIRPYAYDLKKEVQEIFLLPGELGVSPDFIKVPQSMGD